MRSLLSLVGFLYVWSVAKPVCAVPSEGQLFSGTPVSVWNLYPDHNNVFGLGEKGSVVQVPSPNGKRKLEFPSDGSGVHDTWTFFAIVGGHRYPIEIDGYVDPKVIWANDSSAALLSFSDGGANGGWEIRLISFEDGRVAVTDPTERVGNAFIGYRDEVGIRCNIPHEYPNFYPIGF